MNIVGKLEDIFDKKTKRIFGMLKKSRIYQYLDGKILALKFGESWDRYGSDRSFAKRMYNSYEDYQKHQSAKLNRIDAADLSAYDTRYREVLRERLIKTGLLHTGMSVLCLGARIGTEVKSFIDIGCFNIKSHTITADFPVCWKPVNLALRESICGKNQKGEHYY